MSYSYGQSQVQYPLDEERQSEKVPAAGVLEAVTGQVPRDLGSGIRARARTFRMRRMTSDERQQWQGDMEEVAAMRPRSREACRDGIRPCPYVACKFHLYLDVNQNNGHVKFNFPDLEVWEMPYTCALDIAEAGGGVTLEQVGEMMNLTRERVRQVEVTGLSKLCGEGTFERLDAYDD